MPPVPSSEIFDFFLPEFRQNPYAFYKRLRETDPIHWGISFDASSSNGSRRWSYQAGKH